MYYALAALLGVLVAIVASRGARRRAHDLALRERASNVELGLRALGYVAFARGAEVVIRLDGRFYRAAIAHLPVDGDVPQLVQQIHARLRRREGPSELTLVPDDDGWVA